MMSTTRLPIFLLRGLVLVAGCLAFPVHAKDFADFYTRAWYLVVDNPGPARSLSWKTFNVSGPGSYGENVEDPKLGYAIRRETSPRRIDTPWMEICFKTNLPIAAIRIRPSVKPGEAFDLYGARLYLLDKDRRIVWHHRVWNADGQVDYDAGIEFSDRDQLGQILPRYEFRSGLVPAPEPPRPADLRTHLAQALFNPAAMARAIEAYAVKHPALFADKAELLRELEAVRQSNDGKAIDAFSRKVFLRLPAFRRFSEFLAIRRGDANAMGLPANWQGNSSIPVCGYSNALVRVKLFGAPTKLLESDSFIGDVALDWDLSKVAFSTRKPEEAKKGPAPRNGSHGGIGESGWCVAEMDLDRPGVIRELTPTNTPDIDYYDPMYLPDGKMFLVGTVGFQGVPCVGGADQVGNLLLRYTDGRLRRLSFDQDNNWNPVMLPNGRCLYLRWEYTDSAHYFARILMTMNPDGSDQQEYYGSNSYWPNSLFFAKPVPGSSTKFFAIVTGHHGVRRKGELVLFDVTKGRREAKGAVQKLPGWGKPVEPVTADRLVNDARQFFLHPYPLSEEGVLVAMQDYSLAKHFFIAYVDVYDNQWPILVSEDDSFNYLQPLPLERRTRPFEVAPRVDESKTTALVNLVNVYDGPGLAGVPKGTVKKLRVFNYEYCPRKSGKRSCGGHYLIGMEGPWDCRVMIGTVDVEPDGSALFEAPANVPLVLQPLDADGRHLQEMRSWFAAMPGETVSCLGCHQDQNAAPPAGRRTMASQKPPQQIQPWYGPRRNFDFSREVANVVERRCSGCHDGAPERKNVLGQPLPKFNGPPREIYDNLHPYVRRNGPEGDYHLLTPAEFHADTSELVQRLAVGHHGVALTSEEKDRLLTWMNLNVPFYGTWSETGCPDPAMIRRRRELERQVAHISFDPEAIDKPYRKAAFTPPGPVAKLPVTPAPRKRPAPPPACGTLKLDLSPDLSLTLRAVPGGIWMGETEVTLAQMRAFDPSFDNGVYDMHYKDQVKRGYYMNDDPVFGKPENVNLPAIRVSYDQATAFCRWLSEKTGRKVRLPTESEWEEACGARADAPFFWGGFNDDFSPYANLADVTRRELAVKGIDPKPIPNPPKEIDFELKDERFDDGVLHLARVGSYKPNAYGLHDMIGNAAEWTSTDFALPGEARAGGRKVVKGGSFNDRPHKALLRWGYPAWMRPFDVGFRIVVEPQAGELLPAFDVLKMPDGTRITTAAEWTEKAKPQIFSFFEKNVYGPLPPRPAKLAFEPVESSDTALDGTATRRQFRLVSTDARGAHAFEVLVYTPRAAKGKVPVFVCPNFSGNHSIVDDPAVRLPQGKVYKGIKATEAGRGQRPERIPVRDIVAKGFAIATFCASELYVDYGPRHPAPEESVWRIFPPERRGPALALTAWAWGNMRTLDLLETLPGIDASRAAVVGQSRLAKVAVITAAYDARFKLCCPNDGGCKTLALVPNLMFPHWFAPGLTNWTEIARSGLSGAETAKLRGEKPPLPFDQASLIGCIAPRKLYLGASSQDVYAPPDVHFAAIESAAPVWRLFGKTRIPTRAHLVDPEPFFGDISWHCKPGAHSITRVDWSHYLDFASQAMKGVEGEDR